MDRESADRQATWVALRTLRQRPTLVGRAEDGAPVYEIRSVRLVLATGATHFRRLVTCARCEREVPGPPVLTPADLARPASLVFCDRCARSPASVGPEAPSEREDPPAPPVVTESSAGDQQRLSEQLAGLLRGQNAELAKLSAAVAGVHAEMRQLGEANQALARGHRELDQRMVGLAAEVAAHPGTMVDATAEQLHAALDQLRSQMASLQQRIDDEAGARAEVGALAELNRRDVGELAGQLAARAGEDAARHAEDVAGRGAEESMLRVELGEGLQLLRAEMASVEQRSRDGFAEVATLLEALRQELMDAVHEVAHETLMAVAEPLRDLTKAREEFERRLENLEQKVQEDQRRVEALHASASAGASRLHVLEQKLHTSMQRLIHPAGANPEAERRPSRALMDSLDRQLREAEERLGQL